MVSWLEASELLCVVNYLLNKKRKKKIWPKSIRDEIKLKSGLFPDKIEILDKFSEFFLECVRDIDMLGVWFQDNEDYVYSNFCPNALLIGLGDIEPYYYKDPWSAALEGKKVLVVHPFSELIEKQYRESRGRLFANPNVLPDFDLKTLKAIQSVGGQETRFKDWFDAYKYMCEEIEKVDFDVAIIGAGAYGLPLASFVKKLGKQAVHMGGAVQILFGIKGKRWDEHEVISGFYNEFWVRPDKKGAPPKFKKVDDGAYW